MIFFFALNENQPSFICLVQSKFCTKCTIYVHDSAYFQCLQAEIFGQRFFPCQVVVRKPQLR